MSRQVGEHSVRFEKPPVIMGSASVVGEKEGKGAFSQYYDRVEMDPMFGTKTWEEAESKMQQIAATTAVDKSPVEMGDLRYIVAGDLLGQLMATSFGIMNLNIPMFGVYGACSTMGESIALASILVEGGYAEHVLALTSSHFASAEKQFRFPLSYGNQRPYSSTWTVTGSGAILLSSNNDKNRTLESEHRDKKEKRVVVHGFTAGRITDYGIKDSMNMGACMAPAAAVVIRDHLRDFQLEPEEYDKIITGDLGEVGQSILNDMLQEYGYDISSRQMDCGAEIYYNKSQKTNAGGSGCGCSAVTLCGYILNQLRTGVWKKVLFVPTGALLSTVSFNEGQSVPGIAYAVSLVAEGGE